MDFQTWFNAGSPDISLKSADAVLRLVSEGSTVPFIARYRKEQTGNLDEVQIQAVIDAKENWDSVVRRQEHILGEIDKQKKLTPELREKILSTYKLEELDDLYLPYKLKRKTKAALAREAGLEPLAQWIWDCGHGTETPQPGQTLEIWAFTYKNEAKEIPDAVTAISGAQDILIERLSEIQHLRQLVRTQLFEKGFIRTVKAAGAKPHSKFENYFNYHESVQDLLKPQNSHRYLALRRGWMEDELTLTMGGKPEDEAFENQLIQAFENEACTVHDSPGAAVLLKSARLAFKAHVQSSIENEVQKALKQQADEAAAKVFAENVRRLLLASPFGPKAVLGVDPGIRTGCKLAVVDDSGKFLASSVIRLQSNDEREKGKILITEAVKNAGIRAIAVGNGTAGRETEIFLRKTLTEAGIEAVPVVMVSESGASIYSASEVAREEFPDLDLTVRGAISIARRLQDPLAELVKVDPKSIGVGQYQHDIAPALLKRSLDLVVDSCVNQVGVNLNTASYHLLARVAGIGPGLAKSIVEHRSKKGLFRSRKDLFEVGRFSDKVFEQAAGFLRVPESSNPLDNTGVHPERYEILEKYCEKQSKTIRDLMGAGVAKLKKDIALLKELGEELGEFTFRDIITELEKPGRDPREEFVPFQYRDDIHEVKDLKPGLICPGIVTNVTNFGAFVDIGVHQDGLVHLSQLSNHFIKDPREVVNPGDRVQVRVLEVNLEKSQIALSMKGTAEGQHRATERERPKQQKRAAPPPPKPSPPKPSEDGPRIAPKAMAKAARPARPIAPKSPFNNAFAGLATLKDQLKDKK